MGRNEELIYHLNSCRLCPKYRRGRYISTSRKLRSLSFILPEDRFTVSVPVLIQLEGGDTPGPVAEELQTQGRFLSPPLSLSLSGTKTALPWPRTNETKSYSKQPVPW